MNNIFFTINALRASLAVWLLFIVVAMLLLLTSCVSTVNRLEGADGSTNYQRTTTLFAKQQTNDIVSEHTKEGWTTGASATGIDSTDALTIVQALATYARELLEMYINYQLKLLEPPPVAAEGTP